MIPEYLTYEAVRAEGTRLGLEADDLDEFTDIVVDVDRHHVAIETSRTLEETRRAMERARHARR